MQWGCTKNVLVKSASVRLRPLSPSLVLSFDIDGKVEKNVVNRKSLKCPLARAESGMCTAQGESTQWVQYPLTMNGLHKESLSFNTISLFSRRFALWIAHIVRSIHRNWKNKYQSLLLQGWIGEIPWILLHLPHWSDTLVVAFVSLWARCVAWKEQLKWKVKWK